MAVREVIKETPENSERLGKEMKHKFCMFVAQQGPITVEMDNRSLLLTLENRFYNESSRHWQLRFRFLIDQLGRGSFVPKLTASAQMSTDRLTKVVKNGHHRWVDRVQNDVGGRLGGS